MQFIEFDSIKQNFAHKSYIKSHIKPYKKPTVNCFVSVIFSFIHVIQLGVQIIFFSIRVQAGLKTNNGT